MFKEEQVTSPSLHPRGTGNGCGSSSVRAHVLSPFLDADAGILVDSFGFLLAVEVRCRLFRTRFLVVSHTLNVVS